MKWNTLHSFKEKFTRIYVARSLITVFFMVVVLTFEYIRTLAISNANKSSIDHLNILSRINSKVMYLNVFTLETILKHESVEVESENMVEYYGSLIYDDLVHLSEALKDNFLFNLDSYKELYFKIRNENICLNFFLNEPSFNFTGKWHWNFYSLE